MFAQVGVALCCSILNLIVETPFFGHSIELSFPRICEISALLEESSNFGVEVGLQALSTPWHNPLWQSRVVGGRLEVYKLAIVSR